MKKLPVGLQTFRDIIAGGYVYADKTKYVHDLASQGKYFFLSRPRRFGKSLLVDTIKEAFEGHRELFDGLWLGRSDFDFTPHPVIRLDMSMFDLSDRAMLRSGVSGSLLQQAAEHGLGLAAESPASLLEELIRQLHASSGRQVVVLIDEYDKPIIDHLDRPDLAAANREELRYLYGVLKGSDSHLRLVFLTGVSKFTRTSIFSQLNNLTDITLRESYANICGITAVEFDALFGEYLAALAQHRSAQGLEADPAKLRDLVFSWYDGYSWDGRTRVFNPFSLLSFFQRQEFYPYWFVSGFPKFLMERIQADPASYAQVQEATITELAIDSHEIEHASLESLLFQTGFLTVREVFRQVMPPRYQLSFPNIEVSTSFSTAYLDVLGTSNAAGSWQFKTQLALDEGRPEFLEEALTGLFASIPYELHLPQEAFYHAVFLAVMQFLGFSIIGELSVAGGRVDGVIDTASGKSYVIELKYVKAPAEAEWDASAALGEALNDALAQIETKGYANRYTGTDREVWKVAVAVAGRDQVKVRAIAD